MKVVAAIQSLTLAILTAIIITACQGKAERPSASSLPSSEDCRTIEHEQGATEICGQPQRIVVLGPYFLEPLLALGVQPVAFADHVAFRQEDYDNPRQQIPYLGDRISGSLANVGSVFSPSIEAIVKVQPDLIIGADNNATQYETFSRIAPTLSLNWSDTEDNLKAIARAVNRSGHAEQIFKETEQRIAAAREDFTSLVATHPKLLMLSSSQLQEISLIDSAGLCTSLPKELGFELMSLPELANTKPNTPVPISIETLPQLNDADLVVMLGHNFSQIKDADNFKSHQLSKLKQAWSENEIAQSLDASQAGRVYFIPAYKCLGLPGAIGTELYLEELKKQLLPPQ